MTTLTLTPAQRSYLDLLELLRSIAPSLGREQQFDLTKRLAVHERSLFGSARIVLAWKRLPQTEAEIERRFLSPQPDGCGPCRAEQPEGDDAA